MDETAPIGDTFAPPADTGPQVNDFSAFNTQAPTDQTTNGPADNPITPRLLSLATNPSSISAIQDQSIAAAQQLLQQGQEFSTRLQVANQRQQQQATNFAANQKSVMAAIAPSLPSADQQTAGDNIYNSIIQQNTTDAAKASIERQAVDRIHDDLSGGNPVEAKLTYDLMFGSGDATKVWHDEAAKNLIIAQAVQKYQSENDEKSWLGAAYDTLTSLIPFNDNFAHVGDVPGSEGGIKNFLLSGTSLQSQGEYAWNKYRTPEELATALQNGGELDAAIRSNATSIFHQDPGAAAGILKGLDYENVSDAQAANAWSLVNVGAVVPWAKVTSIPKLLTNIGSRSLARAAVTDAAESIIANGPEQAAAKTGIKTSEVINNLEPSTLNPNVAGPNRVPLAADANSSLEAMQAVREAAPEVFQTSGFTNLDELQAARKATIDKIVETTNRPVKDIKPYYEDLRTGERNYIAPEADLPEQGHVVHGVEVTWGKADGGGFARPETAISNAYTKLGIVGAEAVGSNAERETAQTAAEAGFTDRAFHGTGRAFDRFDPEQAGSATGAENTRGGVSFFSTEPDVAMSYARKAASADNHSEMARLQKLFNANPADEKIADQFEEAIGRVADDSGANIRPVDIDKRNMVEYDMKGRAYNGPETQTIIDKARADGKDGVVLHNYDDDIMNGKPSTIYAVFDHSKIRSAFEGPVIKRDTSGQWFAQARFHVPENGFRTTPLNTPSNNFFSALRSNARRIDRDGWQKAVQGGVNGNKLVEATQLRLKDALKGIPEKDKLYLDEIIRKGQNASRWFDDREFSSIYERAKGELPSDKVLNAYKVYHEANDFDFTLRREQLYKTDVNAGREHVSFEIGASGQKVDGIAKVEVGGTRPTSRVFDASTGQSYNPKNPLTEEEFKRLTGEGYLNVKLKESMKLPDGTHVDSIMIKRADIERRALSRDDVLGYKAGGHRVYTGKYFAKQAVEGVQPDTGGAFLKNPNVFRTSNNPNMLREWAGTMNAAIKDAKSGIMDPQHYEDNVFANLKGIHYPSGQEFLDSFNNGLIDKTHAIEVVGDRELPSIYSKGRDDAERFLDEQETSAGGYYRTTGRLYTSGRGDALLDESGEFAETVDPWQTTSTALENINKLQSMDAYKSNVLERFKNTYADQLKLRNLENVSAFDMINAEVRDDVSSRMARQIRAEQGAVKHIMNFETAWEKNVRGATRELAEWVLGDAQGGAKLMAHDFVYWLSKNNPVNTLRGIAFDAKLGLFNVGQFAVQSMTMSVSIALSPKHGLKGFGGAFSHFAYVTSKGNEAVLDTLAKNGAWKVAAFESEKEFKDFNRFMYSTNFSDVQQTHLAINDFRPNRYFGAASKVDAVRQTGRVFFYKAELMNRSVAGRIAWEELKEHGFAPGTNEFRSRWLGLADDYSMNMTHESSAQFQKGLWSIPTQFWGYNIRMMDAMLGNRFSTAAKTRLVASQLFFFGAAGVPALDVLDEFAKNKWNNGQPVQTGSALSLFDRGTVDNALAAITGADVRVGERVGVNTSFIKDIFGLGANAPKTPLDVLGGATYTISAQIGSTMIDTLHYAYAESGGDQGYPITRDMVLKMASNVSTFGNGLKAMMVNNYGIYQSNNGTIQANDVPRSDAFAVALGFVPQEINNAQLMSEYMKDQTDVVKDASAQVRNWRQEAMANPDVAQENMRKVNLFMQLLPRSIQQEVLRKTNKLTDESAYESVARRYTREIMNESSDTNNGTAISNP